ncbi:hypothetical protein [Rhizobium tumorigenes]|uniref:hypothetical protein n=1 Tax=Rhizobium tumorigenes TaxID=2041385 RepID=UPI00241D2A32|nr:hypothetical protein [Rhizobium tumorigenes]WFS02213.1 hypothetical protein PR016_06260 [Rhizobium tumorigenes]
MTIDRATIINWALTDIGAGPMFSIDDGSDLAMQVDATWQRTVDQIFGMHDWHFSLVTVPMRRLAGSPGNGWQYGFDLPGDRIGAPLAYFRCIAPRPGLIRDFSLEEGKFFANEQSAWAKVKKAVDPDYWDPPWRSAFVKALGGELAVPVWQDEDLRERRRQEAFGTPSQQGTGGVFGRLMAQDKASAPVGDQSLLTNDVLTDVRPTGGMHSGPWHGSF